MPYYGGIEAGGTKFVCMVAQDPDHIIDEIRFPTTTPAETLNRAVDFFKSQAARHPLSGVGIAAFGPLDLDPHSPTYGSISATPKVGWTNTDIRGEISQSLQLPVAIDTDVNGAALGEYRWGAGQGADPFVYITIGTGIGGGAIIHGKPLHGLVHPEMGHVLLPRDPQRDPFPGGCPFHGDCFEGLAAGPALQKRWGQPGETLPPGHPAWELEAHYIALALANLILTLSPQRIVLGGGVMQNQTLFPAIRRKLVEHLGGYVQAPAILAMDESFIRPPGLGARSGVLGAIALAADGPDRL